MPNKKMREALDRASDEDLTMMHEAYPSNIWVKQEVAKRKKKKKESEGGMEYKNSPAPSAK